MLNYEEYINFQNQEIPKDRLIFCKSVYKIYFNFVIRELNNKIKRFNFLNEWHNLDEDDTMYYGTLKTFLLSLSTN